MSDCRICGNKKSPFVMNNKTVCMRCDELLFDIEIECDDEPQYKLLELNRPTLKDVKTGTQVSATKK